MFPDTSYIPFYVLSFPSSFSHWLFEESLIGSWYRNLDPERTGVKLWEVRGLYKT